VCASEREREKEIEGMYAREWKRRVCVSCVQMSGSDCASFNVRESICVRVCVCERVCVTERERERKRKDQELKIQQASLTRDFFSLILFCHSQLQWKILSYSFQFKAIVASSFEVLSEQEREKEEKKE